MQRPREISPSVRCAVVALATVAVFMLSLPACGRCSDAPDEDDLPIVKCAPVAPGEGGCRGLPGNHPGPQDVFYPERCAVDAATDIAACGYAEFFCPDDSEGTRTYYWGTYL